MRQQKNLLAALRGKHPEILFAGSKHQRSILQPWALLSKIMHMNNSTSNSTSNTEANEIFDYF